MISRSLAISLISVSILLAACGKGSTFHALPEIKKDLFKAPEQSTAEPTKSANEEAHYSVYDIKDVKIGFNKKKRSVSVRAAIKSTAGEEIVRLVGVADGAGNANVSDVSPLEDGQYRMIGSVSCQNDDCTQAIVDLFINVNGKSVKKQFVTLNLVQKDLIDPTHSDRSEWAAADQKLPDSAFDKEEPGEYVGAPLNLDDFSKLLKRTEVPQLAPESTDFSEANAEKNPTDVLKDGSIKTDSAPVPPSKPGEASSENNPLNQTPQQPAQPKAETPKTPEKTSEKAPEKTAAKPAAKKETGKATPKREPVPQKEKPATPAKVTPKKPSLVDRVIGFFKRQLDKLMHPEQETSVRVPIPQPAVPPPPTSVVIPEKPAPKPETPKPVEPAKPAAPKPDAPKPAEPAKPAPAKPAPAPAPAKPAPAPAKPAAPPAKPAPQPAEPGQVRTEANELPFPPAAVPKDAAGYTKKLAEKEVQLAPLMNLRDGGRAKGAGDNGSIVNASRLPEKGAGYEHLETSNANATYGTGMLISFLQNAADYFVKALFPDETIYYSDISKKFGGKYGSHNQHRNGLDADVGYFGLRHPLQESAFVGDTDVVSSNLKHEEVWAYLKLALKQTLISGVTKETSLSRVFMSPGIKKSFCTWAEKKGLTKNEDDRFLLRSIRNTGGHDKHFHLMLKCSPHYPGCLDLADRPDEENPCAN